MRVWLSTLRLRGAIKRIFVAGVFFLAIVIFVIPISEGHTKTQSIPTPPVTLQERQKSLLSEIPSNPKVFFDQKLSTQALASVPTEARDLVEKPISESGTLKVILADTTSGQEAKIYQFQRSSGEKLALYIANDAGNINQTVQANINGYQLGNLLVLENSDGQSIVAQSVIQVTQVGVQTPLIVRFHFHGGSFVEPSPLSRANLATNFYGASSSVDSYYKENSYNKVSLSGSSADISNWYDVGLSAPDSCSNGDVFNWSNLAFNLADSDYNMANYNRLVFIFPTVPSCTWAGLGQVGGTDTSLWSNGYGDVSLFTHELGHNFGAGHASRLQCTNADSSVAMVSPYDYNGATFNSARCVDPGSPAMEYDDNYDTMGYWNTYHLNAAFKYLVGWITDAEVVNVTGNQTIDLGPIESAVSVKKAARLTKSDTGEEYWFEYRQKIGYDSGLPTGLTNGVIAHVYSDFYENTFLLDGHTADYKQNYSFMDGVSTDELLNGYRLSGVSHDSNSAQMNIEFISHNVTVNKNAGGQVVAQSGAAAVNGVYRAYKYYGETFNVVPDSGYRVKDVNLNGVDLGAVSQIVIPTDISTNETLNIEFEPTPVISATPVVSSPNFMSAYRFLKSDGTHFYTASEAEKNNIVARWPTIYKLEGVAYRINMSNSLNNTPLYRFYNKVDGTHFYTASEAEKNNIIAKWPNIYQFEGVAYSVSLGGATPIYRFYKTDGTHFFTANIVERNTVIAKWPSIYKYEGVAFSVN